MTTTASSRQTPDRHPLRRFARVARLATPPRSGTRGWAWLASLLGSLSFVGLTGCAEQGPFLGGANRNQELILRNASLETENRDLRRQLASMRDITDQVETELAELRRRESFITAGRRYGSRVQDEGLDLDPGFESPRNTGTADEYRRPRSQETEQDWQTPDNSPMADAREDEPFLRPASPSSGAGTRRAAGSLDAVPGESSEDPNEFELYDLFSDPDAAANDRLPPPDADPDEVASGESDWQTPSVRAALRPSDSNMRSTASDSRDLADRRSEPSRETSSPSSPRPRVRSGSAFPTAPWPDDSPLRDLPGAELFREPPRTPWLSPSRSSGSPSRPSPRQPQTPSRVE